jgi:membrane protease YdiL (CAAX protease family)
MDSSPAPTETSRKRSWIDRVQAIFEIVLISGLISSFLAFLPFSVLPGWRAGLLLNNAVTISIYLLLESAITFFFLAIILRARGESLYSLGLCLDRWKPNVAIGLMLVPFLFLINGLVNLLFRVYLPKYYTERNPLTESIHSWQQLLFFILAALIAGGVKEEVQRAFILNRFRRYLGGAGVGLVLWSLAFGAGHYVQGAQAITAAALYGFIFGVIYLASGNLIAPMVAHGAYDTVALIVYWLASGRFK